MHAQMMIMGIPQAEQEEGTVDALAHGIAQILLDNPIMRGEGRQP